MAESCEWDLIHSGRVFFPFFFMLSELSTYTFAHSISFLFLTPFFSKQTSRSVSLSQLESFLSLANLQSLRLPLDWRLIISLSFVLITAITLLSQRKSKFVSRLAALTISVNLVLLALRRTLTLYRSLSFYLRFLKTALLVRSSLGWLFGQRFVSALDSVAIMKVFSFCANATEPVVALFRKVLPVRVKHLDVALSGLVMSLDLVSSLVERELL